MCRRLAMRNIKSDFLLISGELAGLSFNDNLKRSLNLEQCLQDLNLRYTTGVGMYEGTKERCYLVRYRNEAERQVVISLALDSFDQQCVLNHNRGKVLCISKELVQLAGTGWQLVPDNLKHLKQAYTEIGGETWELI
jgi:hypothetical protein